MKSHNLYLYINMPMNCEPRWKEFMHEFAELHLQLRSDQMKNRYNSSIGDGKSLQKGDPVWLYWPQWKNGLSPKLMRSWRGPYYIDCD